MLVCAVNNSLLRIMSNTPEPPADIDYSTVTVPQSKRRSFANMLFLMLGFTFCSSSMMVGAQLGNGFDLPNFLLVILLGGLLLSAYTGMLGYIGSRTGYSLDLLCRRAFGRVGSYLPSTIIVITQIGWFGVVLGLFSVPTAEVLHINPWWVVIIGGVLMTASSYYGVKGLIIISAISVPLVVLLGCYSVGAATIAGGGIVEVFAKKSGGLSFMIGIDLVVASFVSGGTTTPNFTRYSRTPLGGLMVTVAAFLFGNSLMFIFGAAGGAFTGKDDIFYVMIAQGLIIPALFVLGTNTWTTNDNSLYSCGLGLANLTRRNPRPLILIAGIIGTLASLWLRDNFVNWLIFLSAILPPIGMVLILDYFVHRKRYQPKTRPYRGVFIGPVLSVGAGVIAGTVLKGYGISAINGMVVSSIVYLLWSYTAKLKKE